MTKRQKQPQILLFPDKQQIDAKRNSLAKFEPHNLGSLLKEINAGEKGDSEKAFVLAFRRRNQEQIHTLLRRLGIDPSQPNAYERGFFLLGVYHHGIGGLAWSPRRTNRNSASWTWDDDLRLLKEVKRFTSKGFSERYAVKQIAADPRRTRLFPYRPQRNRVESKRISSSMSGGKRESALWARLQHLKSSAPKISLYELLGGGPEELSFYNKLLCDLDKNHSLQRLRIGELVKNQRLPE